MTSLSDAHNVRQKIQKENDALNDSIFINTYAVIDSKIIELG